MTYPTTAAGVMAFEGRDLPDVGVDLGPDPSDRALAEADAATPVTPEAYARWVAAVEACGNPDATRAALNGG